MARLTMLLYGFGATLVLTEAARMGAVGDPGAWRMAGVGLAAATASLVLLWCGARLKMPVFHLLMALGTALITLAGLTASTATVATAIAGIYAFVAFAAVYASSARAAAAHITACVLACLALLIPREGAGPAAAVMVIGVFCAIGTVLGPVVARASGAGIDILTGLLNRRGYEEALEGALSTAERAGAPLSLALIDVDYFKAVNDRAGHAGGDALLAAIARDCTALLPTGSLLARVGGDEFAVAVAGVSGQRTAELLQELLPAAGHAPRQQAGAGGHPLSIGVAQRRAGESAGELARRADAALYRAKAAGRGRVLLDGASDPLVRDLRMALAAGRISVALQPLVALDEPEEDARVVGVEALARWRDPARGAVSPADFIPAAEGAELIDELGRQILVQAAADVVRLQHNWGRRVFLTVNASGHELVRPTYADDVLHALTVAGLPPADLVVEVTESVAQASTSSALHTLEVLRGSGVKVAIDDFGTGYSTLARLDHLPADYLKLDASFTREVSTSERRRTMLSALSQMASALGMVVIAEGVETKAQADLVHQAGCALAQGHLFARPSRWRISSSLQRLRRRPWPYGLCRSRRSLGPNGRHDTPRHHVDERQLSRRRSCKATPAGRSDRRGLAGRRGPGRYRPWRASRG